MTTVAHYEDPTLCPKCGTLCSVRINVAQERENACPSCGVQFVDMSEQFEPGNYQGLFYSEADQGSPPIAMFAKEEDLQKYLAFLENSKDEDDHVTARQTTALRCSVYGVYWNGGLGEDPWADKFQPFVPDDLPAEMPLRDLTFERDELDPDDLSQIRMDRHFEVGGGVPVFFCPRTYRWYLFWCRDEGTDKPVVEYQSLNDGPGNVARTHLHGVWSVARHITGIKFLTWEQYREMGGKIKIPSLKEE